MSVINLILIRLVYIFTYKGKKEIIKFRGKNINETNINFKGQLRDNKDFKYKYFIFCAVILI